MNTNTNTIKAVLSFIWVVPFVYKFINLYSNIGNYVPAIVFQAALVLSFIAAITLLLIWFKEFFEIRYFKKAFYYLNKQDLSSLDRIYGKIPKQLYQNYGTTLLQYAIDNQLNEEIVFYLLNKGDLVDFTENADFNLGATLFNLAAYYNYFNDEMFNYLINNGAYINFIDDSKGFEGLSILHCLILRGNINTINIAIKYGADLNYFISDQSLNALMLACKYVEEPIIIKTLLDSQASVNTTNKDGYNALLIAAKYNHNPAIITMLINYGAKIQPYSIKEAVLKTNTITPLYLAASSNTGNIVEKLIDLGDDINFNDDFGMSVLFIACAHNTNVEVVKTLTSAGITLDNSTDSDGNTALMVASYLNPNPNVIRYILNKSHNLGTVNKDGLSFADYLQQNASLSKEEKEVILNKWI